MPNPLNSVLNLIAATILADKRIYASEVETFLRETNTLGLIRELDPNITEMQLLQWYEFNKDAIESNLSTPYFKDWLYSILEQLSSVEHKETILSVMKKIAKADNEVHVSEQALITLTERYWDRAA